ncbi:MAG: S-layer homology domain-containing protein [Lawsonibacter sp.]|nr:S-layer homology domain-containing protein [Lawsonibacter sp.]
MSKKFLSLALALAMCLGLTVPAFAAEEKLKVTITFDGYLRTEYVKGDGENSFLAVQVVKDGSNVKLECPGAERLAVEDWERTLDVQILQHTKGAGLVPGTAAPFLDGLSLDSGGVIIDVSTKMFAATSADTGSSIFLIGYNYNDYFDVEETYWMSESGYAQLAPEHKGVPGAGSEIRGVVEPDKPTQPTVPTVGGFTDVKKTDWFADPVLWAVEKKITAGTSDTTFSPNADCTTAQILSFLWRANGSPKPTMVNPFSDVKSGDWYADAAAWAYEKGLVSGTAFGGDTLCTRSMAVTYMWKAAGSPSARAASFTDVSAGAEYADAVAWAVEQGVTAGTSATTFSPDSVCTRGQIVSFLYRGLAE